MTYWHSTGYFIKCGGDCAHKSWRKCQRKKTLYFSVEWQNSEKKLKKIKRFAAYFFFFNLLLMGWFVESKKKYLFFPPQCIQFKGRNLCIEHYYDPLDFKLLSYVCQARRRRAIRHAGFRCRSQKSQLIGIACVWSLRRRHKNKNKKKNKAAAPFDPVRKHIVQQARNAFKVFTPLASPATAFMMSKSLKWWVALSRHVGLSGGSELSFEVKAEEYLLGWCSLFLLTLRKYHFKWHYYDECLDFDIVTLMDGWLIRELDR